MVKTGKGPLEVIQFPVKQGSPKQVLERCAQIAFEYLQRERLHSSLSRQCVPVLGHAHSKEILTHVQVEFLLHQFLSIASCPIVGQHQPESGSILLALSLQILIDFADVPALSSLLQPEQARLSPSAFPHPRDVQSLKNFCYPRLDPLQELHAPLS